MGLANRKMEMGEKERKIAYCEMVLYMFTMINITKSSCKNSCKHFDEPLEYIEYNDTM